MPAVATSEQRKLSPPRDHFVGELAADESDIALPVEGRVSILAFDEGLKSVVNNLRDLCTSTGSYGFEEREGFGAGEPAL